MKKEIPLSVPNLDISIVENLQECIETGWVSTGGRFITEFEEKTAAYLNVTDAVSTQSGTAGLQLALRALNIGPGDEVIVPTLTFIATVNPVIYQGAAPVFMDCDDTLCLDTEKLASFLKHECSTGKDGALVNKASKNKVKAIMPVHIFGNMADMETIMDLAAQYHLSVVEDAAEALGTKYTTGRYVGKHAGTIGDIGVYSFNANKIITTGGGGMVTAKEKQTLDHIRHLSLTAKNDPLNYVHDEVGYNYRMLNLQAALGVNQIDKLEEFIEVKQSNYNLYRKELNAINGLTILPFRDDIRSNHWFYSLLIDQERINISRDTIMHKLISQGIQCRPVWKLCHKQSPYLQYQNYNIGKAPLYEKNILNLPCSTSLQASMVRDVCQQIRNFISI